MQRVQDSAVKSPFQIKLLFEIFLGLFMEFLLQCHHRGCPEQRELGGGEKVEGWLGYTISLFLSPFPLLSFLSPIHMFSFQKTCHYC